MAVTSGNFDYNSLVRTLKEDFNVKTADLSSVLRKIASSNNIDDIKNLDKSKKININIFDNGAQTNPFSETLSAYNADIEAMMAKSPDKLPEIYNDDEYEVSEYDDYYGFEDKTQSPAAEKNNEALDFESFKEQYATSILDGPGNKNDQNEFLKQIFAQADINSDNFLDKTELSGAFYAAEQFKQPNSFESDTSPKEGDDLLGVDMMQMNMSNDSFNPQG